MACPGLGLPAGAACPALDECLSRDTGDREAICRRCYAQRGRYRWKPVQKHRQRTLEWWLSTGPSERAETLAAAVRKEGNPRYFRCYDSGDLMGRADADTWLLLADLLPGTKFWIPTKTWILRSFDAILQDLAQHPSIVVRPSAVCFGDPPPCVEGLAAGSAAPLAKQEPGSLADHMCPGGCGPCRVCWDSPELSVEYHRK